MAVSLGEALGAFTVEKALAGGETASVFLAYDTARPALKAVLKLAFAAGQARIVPEERLRRETDVLRALRHPGIVRIYPLLADAGDNLVYMARVASAPGRPWYYAMEYIEGESLDALIQTFVTRYSLEWRLELFYQLLTIVDYMHQNGYAHGDLKPQNILFRRTPTLCEVPGPVLVGFGAALPLDADWEAPPDSFLYTAPEALLAAYGGIPRANIPLYPDKLDIWALGAILFEILVGRPLVTGQTWTDALDAALNDELESITDVRPDLPGALDTLVRVMLRRNPETRPPAAQLIQAVEERMVGFHPPRVGCRPGTGEQ